MFRKLFAFLLIAASLLGVYSLTTAQSGAADEDLEANKELVSSFVAALNSHDLDNLDGLLSDDYQEHNPFAPEFPPGPETFKAIAGGILAAFPDVEVTIDYMVAEGDLVATRHTVVATHEGDFNGVPATGNEVTWTENHLYRIEDGQIAEHWAELNLIGILQQIGAFPPPE